MLGHQGEQRRIERDFGAVGNRGARLAQRLGGLR
jgi:hypothetical protein